MNYDREIRNLVKRQTSVEHLLIEKGIFTYAEFADTLEELNALEQKKIGKLLAESLTKILERSKSREE